MTPTDAMVERVARAIRAQPPHPPMRGGGMSVRQDSPPELAAARIKVLHDVAKELSIKTGGDPAECVFELICAAVLVCHESRPTSAVDAMIAGVAADAAATVEAWFAKDLKAIRCRHG